MQGVFFDLGGTLFSYRNVPRVTVGLLMEAVARLGVQASNEQIKDAHAQASRDMSFAYAERAYYLQTGKQLTSDVQELQRTQIKA